MKTVNRPRPPRSAVPTPLPPLRATRLLDQRQERIRYLHHGLRHPREMGAVEVESFLSHLAADKELSASTHRQALAALLFLYRQVLGVDLLGHADVTTTQIYTHVLRTGPAGVRSPLDALAI